MPIYYYKVLTNDGKKQNGIIDGDSAKEANIPLYETLKALEEQYRGEKFHRMIFTLCENIKSGSSLSQAISCFPEHFDQLYCGVVASGESVGLLAKSLQKLGELLTKQMSLKKQLISALTYPAIVISFSIIAILALFLFAVPTMQTVFEGKNMNLCTQIIISLSFHIKAYFWLYMIIFAITAFGLLYLFHSTPGRKLIDKILLYLPFIKNVIILSSVARFSRTMSMAQNGGMSMIDSLRISKRVMKNDILEQEISLAEKNIIEGSSLSIEIKNSQWIPPLVSRMLAIGEESGSLAIMLERLADIYEMEVEKILTRVMALITPAVLVITGVIVGLVMLAVLLPLTDANMFMGM